MLCDVGEVCISILNSLTVHISRLYTKRGKIGHLKKTQCRCGQGVVGEIEQLHGTTRSLFCTSIGQLLPSPRTSHLLGAQFADAFAEPFAGLYVLPLACHPTATTVAKSKLTLYGPRPSSASVARRRKAPATDT